jgi:hypothetical protein
MSQYTKKMVGFGGNLGGDIPPQPLFEESNTQKCALGYRWALPDGRVFRYAKNGAVALVAGKAVQAPVQTNGVTYLLNRACGSAAAVGQMYIKVSATNMTADALVDGLISPMSGGLINSYTISGNDATASVMTKVNLKQPVRVATTTSTKMVAVPNMYNGVVAVVAATLANTGTVVGVPQTAVTASTTTLPVYFWLQTYGPAFAYVSGAAAAVDKCLVSLGSGKLVAMQNSAANLRVLRDVVGRTMISCSGSNPGAAVFLTICP